MVRGTRRGCRRIAGALGALALCATAVAAQGGSVPLVPGNVVAVLELEAPSVSPFVLRGTLPLPPQVFPRPDGLVPFEVRHAGVAVPAQVEIVSRYPRESDGADVVELLALVSLPGGAASAERLRFQVVYQPQPAPSFQGSNDVEELLSTPGTLRARTRDVFWHEYQADLYADALAGGASRRDLRQGHVAQGVATHSILMPTSPDSGPTGTLPHMMGVHAYVTRWAGESFFTLDLRVHNALSGLDPSDPADDALDLLYFRSLELVVPAGWRLFNGIDDPYFGAPYDQDGARVWPFVAPLAGDKPHVMPRMSQFHRRFAVVKSGHEQRAISMLREQGLAFAHPGSTPGGDGLFSWWNPATARYFPQRQVLPKLDQVGPTALRAADAAEFAARQHQVATGGGGLYPAEAHGLGWAHPWGVTDGGAVGGEEIWLYDGITTAYAGSLDGYRLHRLRHRMVSDRQPNVLFDKDGRHTSAPSWVVHSPQGDTLPIWWYGGPLLFATDPFGFGSAPRFQQEAVAALGLEPPYQNELLAYGFVDEAHLVRYTHAAKVLAWLGNDAIAKDDLAAQAEGIRMAYNMLPQDLWGGVIPTGLLAARTYVDQHPGWGLPYGRAEAWGLDLMSAAYSLAPTAWRNEVRPWFEEVSQVLSDGQSTCTGILQSTPLYNVFDGQYRCRQSIEAAITENALVSMRESVFRGALPDRVTQVDETLKKSIYAMFSPDVWDSGLHGPRTLIAVGTQDLSTPPFCTYAIPNDGVYAGVDHYQIWSSIAYAFQLTGDAMLLHRAQEMLGGSLTATLAGNQLENLPNRAALLALVQQLGIQL